MIHRSHAPRVHGEWTARWFAGDAQLTELFGPAPTLDALATHAATIRAAPGWTSLLEPEPGPALDSDSLVVLAGQQPVLAGGAALVVHKAVTALALARDLAKRVDRPVVPVFLLATQDADTSEVDHVDLLGERDQIVRLRCPVQPAQEMFARAHWERTGLQRVFDELRRRVPGAAKLLQDLKHDASGGAALTDHVLTLLRRTLGPFGLRFVQAHKLAEVGRPVLDLALSDHRAHIAQLESGAARLREADLKVAFDPHDPRPLVLESRDGRRKRLEADDEQARTRLSRSPGDFSPHAALRPIVQAAALPVVAQVAGPSEILYLGQARELHALHDRRRPLLVPRMEATQLSAAQFEHLAPDFRLEPEVQAYANTREQLLADAAVFARELRQDEPRLAVQLDRWQQRLQRDLQRLAAQPFWAQRQRGALSQALVPRGRPQDAVFAWLPQAWGRGDPSAWVEQLLDMSRGHEPPVHLFHHLSER
ncbi:MAG: hypothetical protein DHS20C15_18170 [Planctomycetota bacterium]|nr:MAG: hypothetical protein DHS20C15_18170 [Planctomycetota bacterium]